MNESENEIRELIEGWVRAIQSQELEGVLHRHADDIVMFDVPPPERGARGIGEYSKTWPPFLDWIASGARFEIDELHVTSGEETAFAWALLWCGTENMIEEKPARRLRLTIGLRRDAGIWQVSHEHHSFSSDS